MKILSLLKRVIVLIYQHIYRHIVCFHIGDLGIEFYYKGDNVIWIWPFTREGKDKWASISFCCYFSSLKEIDQMWDDYFQALQKNPPTDWNTVLPY